MTRAAQRPARLHLLAVRQGGHARTRRSTTPPSSGCAASPPLLRADLRGSGVGVTTVFPGFIRDAGMFADAEVKLPAGVGTRTPGATSPTPSSPAIERNTRRDRRRTAAAAPEHGVREPCAGDGRHGSRGASARMRSPARWPPASATSAEPSDSEERLLTLRLPPSSPRPSVRSDARCRSCRGLRVPCFARTHRVAYRVSPSRARRSRSCCGA